MEAVAHNLLCVEFFPYHSKRFAGARLEVPSQRYSFHLVRAAIARGALLIVMRGGAIWAASVPELQGYARLHTLRNPQNVTVSSGNCPQGFKELLRALSR